MTNSEDKRKIGGWLILPAIGIFLTPIFLAYGIFVHYIPIFTSGYWSSLTTPGTDIYHWLWAPQIIFGLSGSVIFIFSYIYVITLFIKKSFFLPYIYVANSIIFTLFKAVNVGFADFNLEVTESAKEAIIKDFAGTLAATFLWSAYFLTSKRVKETFVKKGQESNHKIKADEK